MKQADARINAAFDRVLVGSGGSRRGWQVLTSLISGPATRAALVVLLGPFDSAVLIQREMDDLQARGWLEQANGLVSLTASGAAQREAVAPLVDQVRQQVSAALPGEDYVTLVRLLGRLTAAL